MTATSNQELTTRGDQGPRHPGVPDGDRVQARTLPTGANEPRAEEHSEERPERTMAPAVDIFEDAEGITVLAEMPGVAKDRLNVQADRNNLLIEGEVSIEMPAGMAALYADVQATRYRRVFTLSGELDPERIEGRLKDGLLTVRIPKRSEFRPRKIEVRAG